MSDAPQADGWWQASDGKFYPPEQHPDARTAPPPAAPPGAPVSGADPTVAMPPGVPPPGGPGGPPPGGQLPPGGPPPGGQFPPGGPTPGGQLPPGGEGEQPKGKAGKIVAIVAVLALLIGGAVGVFLLLGGDDDADDAAAVEEPTDDVADATDDDAADDAEEAEEAEDPDDAEDPGELRPIDGPIELDRTYQESLVEGRTEARFTFDAPDSAILTLTIANDRASERRVIVELVSLGSSFSRFTLAPGATETDTIVLDHQGGAPFELVILEGPAAFDFEVALGIQQDAGQPGDAGDDFASGRPIDAGATVEGLLGGQDTTDVYLLDLVAGSELDLTIDNARDSDRRVIYQVLLDGTVIARDTVNPGASSAFAYLFSGDTDGVIEIIITDGPASYSLRTGLTEQQDGGEPGDASDQLDDPREVGIGEELPGQVGDDDREDLYVFEATAAEHTLTVTNEPDSPRRVIIEVADAASGNQVLRFTVNAGAAETGTFDTEPGQAYRISVTDGRADYRFEVG